MFLKSFDDMQKTSFFFVLKPVNAIYGFIITICLSIVTIIIWSIFSPMDEVVEATAILRPSENISSIKCVTSGQINFKNYSNADSVHAGDLLFTLDTNTFEQELNNYKIQLQKINDEIYNYETLQKTIKSNTLPKLEIDNPAFIKSSDFILQKEKYLLEIKQAEINLQNETEAPKMIQVQQTINDLKLKLEQSQNYYDIWLNNQILSCYDSLKNLNNSRASIEANISEIERSIKNSTIRATIDGQISEVTKINPGDYIISGEEIIKIIPENNQTLKAELYVSASDVSKVKIGNKVILKFPGLPPNRYGLLETSVSLIPPDATVYNGQSIFILEAPITNVILSEKKGQAATLIPGISADAKITTKTTSAMIMLLSKLDFIN